ncbi:MAG: SDR family NAD(P)-dependent oxidoreductase [Candidatus Roizmanbacteria bacterium]|nr:SDR family NAD(P)-dependent oxidoreductase [Candidatus Roizmanbacteria bacterium]
MKTAFVTGGGRGLGKGFVEYFLSQGFQVIAGVRNPEHVTLHHKDLTLVKLDVSSDSSINNAFDTTSAECDHLDYLINNAGINKDSATGNNKKIVCDLRYLDRKILLDMFSINSVAPLIMEKTFLPLLSKSKQAFVVNISSCRSSIKDEFANTNGNYGYRASKAALNIMTYASTFDLPKNVKTYAVHPGDVKTDMNPGGKSDPLVQAEKIIDISKNWEQEFNGHFLRFDGTFYPV